MPKTRWKLVQVSGRLGRKLGERAIFITVIPEKQSVRGVWIVQPQWKFFLLAKWSLKRNYFSYICWKGGVQMCPEAVWGEQMLQHWPLSGLSSPRSSWWAIVHLCCGRSSCATVLSQFLFATVLSQFLFAGLTNSNVWIWLHGMKCVLFSEQHLPNYLGGCAAQSSTRNWILLAIPVAKHSDFFYQDLGGEKMASLCCRVPFTRWEW